MIYTKAIIRPHAAQNKIILHAGRFKVVLCGRRFGKTVILMYVALRYLAAGKRVGIFSPNLKFIEEVWEYFLDVFEDVKGAKINAQKRRIRLSNGGCLDLWSLNSARERKNGRGRDYDVVLYDESQDIEDRLLEWNFEKAVSPTLIKTGGKAWFFGTMPENLNSFFARKFRAGLANNPEAQSVFDYAPDVMPEDSDPDWVSFRQPTHSNPHIPLSEIEKLRKKLPYYVFAREVETRFIESTGNLFLRAMEDFNVQNRIFQTATLPKNLPLTFSFDFNTGVMACTAIRHTRNYSHIEAVAEFGGSSPSHTIYNTIREIQEWILQEYNIGVGKIDGKNYGWRLPVIVKITGDASGRAHLGNTPENATFYSIIQKELGVPTSAFKVREANPTHKVSRTQCEGYIEKHPHFRVDPQKCPRLKSNMVTAAATPEGGLDKKKNDPHWFDTLRYYLINFLPVVCDFEHPKTAQK